MASGTLNIVLTTEVGEQFKNLQRLNTSTIDTAFKDFETLTLKKISDALAVPYEAMREKTHEVTASQLRVSMLERWRQLIATPHVVFSNFALEITIERNFPASKHRSARVRKKLIKRHGSEFRQMPAIWKVGHTYFCHPSFKDKLQEFLAAQPSYIDPVKRDGE